MQGNRVHCPECVNSPDKGQEAGGKLGHELLSVGPAASLLCGQATQLIIGNLYPPHPLSLPGTHPRSCLQFCKAFTLFLVVGSLTESVPLSIEVSEGVDKKPAQKRDKQTAVQQLPPEPACLGVPHPNLNYIYLAVCLIKESSFHASISVSVHAIQ